MKTKTLSSTVSSKGQVTLPSELRRFLDIKAGDKIVFSVDDEGSVRIRRAKYPTLESLRGAAGTLDRPLSWEEIEEIARDDRAEKFRDQM